MGESKKNNNNKKGFGFKFTPMITFIKIMTIIIALKDKQNNRIIFGSDRAETLGQYTETCPCKIITKEITIIDGYYNEIDKTQVYIGASGRGFLINYLEHVFALPDMDEQQDFIEYLYNNFLEDLRGELLDKKIVGTRNEVFNSESNFIIIYKDEIYEISSDFSIHKVEKDYTAIGSGWLLAIGSLYTNLHYHSRLDRVEMVRQALTTCGVNTIYCDTNLDLKIIDTYE